jgi:ABC-type transport system involved in cytochrome c biogenesis permease subunit
MEGLLRAVFGVYIVCGCLYGWYFIRERPLVATAAHAVSWAVFVLHTVFIVLIGIHARVLPVAGLFASLMFFSWLIMLGHLLVEAWSHQRVNGIFVLPLSILLTGFAMQVDKAVNPLPPALQSPWLGIHVSLCFLGYACFLLRSVLR